MNKIKLTKNDLRIMDSDPTVTHAKIRLLDTGTVLNRDGYELEYQIYPSQETADNDMMRVDAVVCAHEMIDAVNSFVKNNNLSISYTITNSPEESNFPDNYPSDTQSQKRMNKFADQLDDAQLFLSWLRASEDVPFSRVIKTLDKIDGIIWGIIGDIDKWTKK